MEQSGAKLSDALLTHCRREFFHAQWCILLDDKFLEAYEHGIVITCQDQVKRRIYPLIFTYSTDYPEKYWLCYSLMPLANVTCIQSFNCDHQELGKMPMPSVSYSEVSHSASGNRIRPTATQAFISL